MAARRLIIVMVVLLAISTLAAAFIPTTPKNPAGGTTATDGNPRQGRGPVSGGNQLSEAPLGGHGLVNARVRISNAPAKVIAVRPGDQLVLEVAGSFGDDVEIPGLGMVETMSNYSPAVFDIYADEAGTFGVRTVETNLLVAKIVVSAVPPKLKVPADGEPGTEKAGKGPIDKGGAPGGNGAEPKPDGAEPNGNGAGGGGSASDVSDRAGAGAHGVERSLEAGPELQ